MRKIKFMTDSTSDLPKSLVDEYEIEIVPLHVLLGDVDHLDDGHIKSKDLFDFADSTGVLPKSAAVNEFEFEAVFTKWLDKDYDIFFLSISSELSATMQSAIPVKSKLNTDRISLVDSRNLSTGESLILLEAADKAKQGASLEEVTNFALSIRDKVRTRFILDTLKYLYMGGRCSKLSAIMGSSLKIKPILELKDGKIIPGDKLRGKSAIAKFIELAMADVKNIDTKRIFITTCMTPNVEEIKKQLEETYGFKNVYIAQAGATISTHSGPGALGIMYLEK